MAPIDEEVMQRYDDLKQEYEGLCEIVDALVNEKQSADLQCAQLKEQIDKQQKKRERKRRALQKYMEENCIPNEEDE